MSIKKKDPKLVWEEIEKRAAEMRYQYPYWREGQALYNATAAMYPEAVEKINGTSDDCFYIDTLIPDFANKVMEIFGLEIDQEPEV